MDGEINIDYDVTPVRWNDDGTIAIKCCIYEDSEEIEKTLDIKSKSKNNK